MKHPSQISILDFTYELPVEKIAVYPLEKRDESKLLIYKQGAISEDTFKNIASALDQNAVLVFNNTKVVRARLNLLNEKNQPIEIFCLEPNADGQDLSMAMSTQKETRWNCLVGNLKRWKEEALTLSANGVELNARIISKQLNYVEIAFSWQPSTLTFAEVLEKTGNLPIPPYLKRGSETLDAERYQTIYAAHEGSVAAPTAGLHFTADVFKTLEEKNIKSLSVTLHVGAGTFKPVKSETMQGHDMHQEWIDVNKETIRALTAQEEKPVIAVGTTSLRTLETLYWMGVKAIQHPNGNLSQLEIKQWDVYELNNENIGLQNSLTALLAWMEKQGLQQLICRTQILIAPPYQLKAATGIITNFHQPQSTLLLLISAITGEKWRNIYSYALEHGFRFLSYGDSSLLLK